MVSDVGKGGPIREREGVQRSERGRPFVSDEWDRDARGTVLL